MNVSVIMPAYNAATTIAQAIESLVAQTAPNWELIVVNDGSADQTGEIVAAFAARDSRVRLINRPNGGESAARNTGIAEARHDWLTFLDADDWVHPGYIERLTVELEADPTMDAVHCGWVRVAADGTEVIEDFRPPTGDLFPTLARRAAFPVNACIIRKALLDAVGGFDTTLRKSADWDLWQRIARAGANFGSVPEMLACYRMAPSSASLDAEQLLCDGLKVLRRGHAPDPRVPNPRPEYANGLPGSTVESQEFYLLCWSAGLLLGSGRDACPLLQLVGDDVYPELYANAVAQCIFEAATLPSCQPRQAWEDLWPRLCELAETFLVALEAQSQTVGLARGALTELKKLVLKHSLTWGPVIEQEEKTAADLRQSVAQFVESTAWLESDRDRWQQRSETADQEKARISTDLEESRRSGEILSAERNALSSALSEAGGRIDALSAEKVELEAALDQLRCHSGDLEQDNRSLQAGLQESRQRIDELQGQRTELTRELADARQQIAQLEEIKGSLESEGDQLRRRVGALQKEGAVLSEELDEWRRSADERGLLVEQIQQEHWVRMGTLLGMMKRRQIVPTSLEKNPRPERPKEDALGGNRSVAQDWNMRVASGNEAHLFYRRGDPEMVRIGITKVGTKNNWDIQLNRSGLKVASGQRYAVVFRARAERPRKIGVGFAKAYDPWSNLGLYTQPHLTCEWQTFHEEFVATADDDNGRIHFDLGGKNIGVDLTAVALQRVNSTPGQEISPTAEAVAQNGRLV